VEASSLLPSATTYGSLVHSLATSALPQMLLPGLREHQTLNQTGKSNQSHTEIVSGSLVGTMATVTDMAVYAPPQMQSLGQHGLQTLVLITLHPLPSATIFGSLLGITVKSVHQLTPLLGQPELQTSATLPSTPSLTEIASGLLLGTKAESELPLTVQLGLHEPPTLVLQTLWLLPMETVSGSLLV
jgi:hypothetical protein